MTKLQKKFIKALRSGKYKQVQGKLETPLGNCCLGVMCRVYNKEYPKRLRIEKAKGCNTRFDGLGGTPPEKVSEAFKMKEGLIKRMISWNDEAHFSFNQIANKLERMWT